MNDATKEVGAFDVARMERDILNAVHTSREPIWHPSGREMIRRR